MGKKSHKHTRRSETCLPTSFSLWRSERLAGEEPVPGSAVDRGSAGEPSVVHSLWQGGEICPHICLLSLQARERPRISLPSSKEWLCVTGHFQIGPENPPRHRACACSFVRLSEARGTTRISRAPAVPVGVGPPTTQTLALDFT